MNANFRFNLRRVYAPSDGEMMRDGDSSPQAKTRELRREKRFKKILKKICECSVLCFNYPL
jgi:hypothetical protein